jgi:cobalt-zinc-cadmium efflux system membrane fusion protein
MPGVFGPAATDVNTYVVKEVPLSITLSEDGELKPKNSVEIKCELEGQSTILEIAEESSTVKKGDLLVELASDAIKERLDSEEIQLRKIESALEAAEEALKLTQKENESKIKKCEIAVMVADLELQRYLEGDFKRALKAAEINIKQTRMDIKRKEDDLTKNNDLFERGFVTASKIDQLKFELEKAQMTLEQNLLQKEILLKYEKPKNKAQKESDVEQTIQELDREKQRAESRKKQALAKIEEQRALKDMRTTRVQRLKTQYDKCNIYAPVDGIVQYPAGDNWRGNNRIAPGEKVYEGQTLVVLPDTSQMLVTTRIHEADRHQVREGLPCLIKVPAVPDRSFTGRISRIAQFAETANRWLNPDLKEHMTEVLLDETDAPISPGDSAEIKILIDEIDAALAVPVQCIYARGSKTYVFVQRGRSAEYVEIKMGRSSTSMVEIVDGLKAGDRVLMHAGNELVSTLPAPTSVRSTLQGIAPPPGGPQRGPAGSPKGPGKGQRPGRRAEAKADGKQAADTPAATAKPPTGEQAHKQAAEKHAATQPAAKG